MRLDWVVIAYVALVVVLVLLIERRETQLRDPDRARDALDLPWSGRLPWLAVVPLSIALLALASIAGGPGSGWIAMTTWFVVFVGGALRRVMLRPAITLYAERLAWPTNFDRRQTRVAHMALLTPPGWFPALAAVLGVAIVMSLLLAVAPSGDLGPVVAVAAFSALLLTPLLYLAYAVATSPWQAPGRLLRQAGMESGDRALELIGRAVEVTPECDSRIGGVVGAAAPVPVPSDDPFSDIDS